MGAIGGLLGASGGASGTGFAAPTSATMTNPTTGAQANQAYNNTQNSMNQQQQLLGALQAQNGLGNQSQVYNQLQGVANGTGPNPAQAQLAQATGANTTNQAALMAGQRGAAGNVGLMARQAAQQGGANQQAAAGQAATLQANQSLNALGQAGSMANTQAANQVGQTNANTGAQQAEQGQLLNSIQGQNANQVAMQSNINNANTTLANTTMQGQQSMIGGAMSMIAHGGVVGYAGGGAVGYADGGNISSPQSSFGQFVNGVSGGGAPSIGSASVGSSSGADALKKGTAALGKTIGGALTPSPSTPQTDANFTMPDMGSQFAGQAPNLGVAGASPTPTGDPGLGVGSDFGVSNPISSSGVPSSDDSGGGGGAEKYGPAFARGGPVKALLSPEEGYIPPSRMDAVKKGKVNPVQAAEKVPGKAKVKGDSLKNDVVPATLESGGVVLPRTVMNAKDPAQAAHKFVSAILAKQGMRKK